MSRLNVLRKALIALFIVFAIAYSAFAQTRLLYREFNPTTGTCSDAAADIITQTSINFSQGWYKCVAGSYVAFNASAGGSGTAGVIPVWSTANTLGDSALSQGATYQSMTTRGYNLIFPSALSTPALYINGAWITGGTGTTNKPHVLIEPTGATSTGWTTTSATGFGVNAASGFTGRLVDFQTNGTSQFFVSQAGIIGIPAAGRFSWSGRGALFSSADGVIELSNNAGNGFTRLNFGSASSSFPALARSTTFLHVKLADNSAFTDIHALNFRTSATGGAFDFIDGSLSGGGSTGLALLRDAAGSSFDRLQFGGTTSSFPALKRSSADLHVRLADDSAYANINANVVTGVAVVASSYMQIVANQFTMQSAGAGRVTLSDIGTGNAFDRLAFGGDTASYPALKRSTTTLAAKLADDSGYTTFIASQFCFSGTTVCYFAGTGTPEGAVTAAVGSTFSRTDGGAGTSFYVKESGAGNTGWVAK